ncbi:MFS transporter [Geodermatophilus sp. URMC 61]|uniref:MFS transporter n=1 Tax=Geodermatophilus sp. URMC 61 TaxID=3423411 RepID=UPI00406D4E4B
MAHTEPDPVGRSALRKVAWRLVPFLGLLYFVNYLDRTNIGFAKLTMSEDLGLTETMFGLASGLFFIGYLLFEVPSNLALHRFGARRWIARILVSWGIVASAMAFVDSAGWLYALRVLLGIAEAGFFPGVLLYLTWWLPRTQRVQLIGAFLVAVPLSSALGAPLSGAVIQYGDGLFGLEGWRVMFLVEGLPAVLLGVACWFYLTDRPEQARWLTPEERGWLTRTIADEGEASGPREASPWRAMASPRVVGLGFVYFGVVYGLYAVSFFLPTVVAGFAERFDADYSIFETGAIVAVPFLAGAVTMLLWSRHSDRTGERRWHLALPAALGGVTIPVALYLDSPFTVMAVITLTAIGICCALPVFWHFPPLILTGAGAAAGIALINSLGNTAGFAAPYITGWVSDATGSIRPALWLVGIAMLLSAVGALLLSRSAREPVGATTVTGQRSVLD